MDSMNCLLLQEEPGPTKSRFFMVKDLSEVIDKLTKIYVEIKMYECESRQEQPQHLIFDLEEILAYYDSYFDIKYLERMQDTSNKVQLGNMMKVYDKKLLLDLFVDQLLETPTEKPSSHSQIAV